MARASLDRFSYGLHQCLHRTFTYRGSPGYTHGVRRLTMLVHRFNARPMTIQRLRCCLSSPHRICLAVSMAVVPSKRNSSMFGSRQQVCERSTAIKLSSYEGERVFPSTKCWVHKSPLVVEKYLKKFFSNLRRASFGAIT